MNNKRIKDTIYTYKNYGEYQKYLDNNVNDNNRNYYKKCSPDKIFQMNIKEFEDYINKLWSMAGMIKGAKVIKDNNEKGLNFEQLKNEFIKFITNTDMDNLVSMWNKFIEIKYMGTSRASELLCINNPEIFVIYNKKSKAALKYLGFENIINMKDDIKGFEYKKVISEIEKVKILLEMKNVICKNYLDVDHYLEYVSDSIDSEAIKIKDSFKLWLINDMLLKEKTSINYAGAILTIGDDSDVNIYLCNDFNKLNEIKINIATNKKNKIYKINEKGHRMYSCALEKYIEFLKSKDNLIISDDKKEFIGQENNCNDILENKTNEEDYNNIAYNEKKYKTYMEYILPRDPKKRFKALEREGYTCELCGTKNTFKTTKNEQYFEGHHLIMYNLNNYKRYKQSLDYSENIICLCPNCHKKIHYGKIDERFSCVKKLFEKHKGLMDIYSNFDMNNILSDYNINK